MQYLKRGLQNVGKAIRQKKLLFAGLVVLQILSLITIVFISIPYQVKILQGAQGVIAASEQANYDPDELGEGQPFIEDMAPLLESYRIMRQSIIAWASRISLVFLFFGGLLWLGSHAMFNRISLKQAGKMAGQYLIAGLIFLAILYLLIIKLVTSNITNPTQEAFFSGMKTLVLLGGIAYYGFLVLAGNLQKTGMQYFHAIKRSIYRTHKVLPILLINALVLYAGMYWVYFTLIKETLALYVLAVTFLLILLIVITRLYWIAALAEVNHD